MHDRMRIPAMQTAHAHMLLGHALCTCVCKTRGAVGTGSTARGTPRKAGLQDCRSMAWGLAGGTCRDAKECMQSSAKNIVPSFARASTPQTQRSLEEVVQCLAGMRSDACDVTLQVFM